ncbi:MAG: hypothetical protein HUU01_07490 [Saprospiraceae bacterium]|nr:hypothetical protein [Saprospiraceae bacterium]
MFTMLKNIWSIEELRIKIINTIKYVAPFVLMSYIRMPEVVVLEGMSKDPYLSIAALGIMPYIASTVFVSFFISDEKKRAVYSKIIALVAAAIQAFGVFMLLQSVNLLPLAFNPLLFILINVASSAFCIFLAEKISEKGICNGRDLLMAVSVLSIAPKAIFDQFSNRINTGEPLFFIFDIALLLICFIIAILISQTLISLPIKVFSKTNESELIEKNAHILMKMNPAGDYSINCIMAIQFIPLSIMTIFFDLKNTFSLSDTWKCIIIFTTILLSTFFYILKYTSPGIIKRNFLFLLNKSNLMPSSEIHEDDISVDENQYDKLIISTTIINAFCLSFLSILPIVGQYWGILFEYTTLIGGASIIFLVNAITAALYHIDLYLRQYGVETFEEICKGTLIGEEVFYLPYDEYEFETDQQTT